MAILTTVGGASLSGRQAMAEIETALASLRKEEQRLTESLAAITDRVIGARADEATALRDLARFKLDAAGESLTSRLDQASRQASDIMTARRADLARLTADRDAKTRALAQHQANLAALRADFDAAEERIEALEGQLQAKLAKDKGHGALVATEEAAVAVSEAAARKADRAEADRAAKSAAYERDSLFIYLWRRGFGTPDYRHGGLVRTLDRWVSNLIGFLEARPAYALLTEIPVRLRAHADRVAEEAGSAAAKVDASADKALAEIAGEDIAGKAAALATGIATQEEAIAPLEKETAALDGKAAAYAAGEDEAFRRAAEALSRSIAGEDIAALRAEAERTPSPEDERFVERLVRARAEITAPEPEAARLRQDLATIADRREEVLRVARDFRSRGWEHRGNSFDFGDLLTGFMLGRISRGGLWGGIERSHRGGSIGGYSGGFGGGFRTGGSFGGGGGFRTGRSFGGGGGFRTGRKF